MQSKPDAKTNVPTPSATKRKNKQKKKKAKSEKDPATSPQLHLRKKSIPISYGTGPIKASSPRVQTRSDGSTVVKNRELLGTLQSNANQTGWAIFAPNLGYQNSGVLRVNAGSESLAPWLAQIAKNFEFYRFTRLCIHYVTRSPTTTAGSILLIPDYDAEDANPLSEQSAAMNIDSVEAPVYENFSLVLKPSRMNALYKAHAVMSDSRFPTTSQDEKTVDAGKIILSGDIVQVSPMFLGKIWVDYECILSVPQSPSTTTSVSLNVTDTLTPNTSNPITTTFATAIANNINGKNPVLVPPQTTSNGNVIGTITKNANMLMNLSTQGVGIQWDNATSGTTLNPLVNLANSIGGNLNVYPSQVFANGPSGSATSVLWQYLLQPGAYSSGNKVSLVGSSSAVITATSLLAATAKLLMTNTDPVPFGLPPITDL